MKFLIHILVLIFFVSCINKESTPDNKKVHLSTPLVPQSNSKKKLEVRTYQIKDKEWGYDIYLNGALYIHQPNIPAIQGKSGFKSKKDAKRVGELAKQKILENVMPPRITVEELDSLGVVK